MNEIKVTGIYRHFKGDYYIVEDIAIHSETKEKYVVYRGLYGNNELYIRPYDMFLSEVDHEKYPNEKQKYRFELQDVKSINYLYKSNIIGGMYNGSLYYCRGNSVFNRKY